MDDLEIRLRDALTAKLAWDRLEPAKRRVDEFYNSGLSDGWTAAFNYIRKNVLGEEIGK